MKTASILKLFFDQTGPFYQDRKEAGETLGRELEELGFKHPLVFGLPRGGVPVAGEVATRLQAPLDVIVARKVGAPLQPELAVAAIAPGGICLTDTRMREALDLSPEELDRLVEAEKIELARRMRCYRAEGVWRSDLDQFEVILVDDGLATGLTARAALASLRRAGAVSLTLAVPVGAPDTVALLEEEGHRVICPFKPSPFDSVSMWYERFPPTTDEEVIRCLRTSEKDASP